MMSTNNKNFLINTIAEAYEDLRKIDAYLSDVRGSIRSCLEAKEDRVDFNLTKELGIYAQQLPELKFLNGKLKDIQTGIRMICSGELTLKEGLKTTGKYLDMVSEALACFNPENFETSYEDAHVEEAHKCNCGSDCTGNCGGNCKCSCNCNEQPECATNSNCEESDSENMDHEEDATDFCGLDISINGPREAVLKFIDRMFP